VTGIVPTNAYPCRTSESKDAREYVVIGANGDSIYNRLMATINRPDLTGPKYQQNQHRVQRQDEIELAISNWTSQRTVEEVIQAMDRAQVPVGRVVSVKDIVENEQMKARGVIRDVAIKDWRIKMVGTFPVLEGVESQPRWAGPDLGEHTNEVLSKDLNLTMAEIEKLRQEGVVGSS
jgi:crotonobetainyl-CoA:carnitine CoA-transferase CaiB-like acyl-CoA transferase